MLIQHAKEIPSAPSCVSELKFNLLLRREAYGGDKKQGNQKDCGQTGPHGSDSILTRATFLLPTSPGPSSALPPS
jgi:hypothetical protein